MKEIDRIEYKLQGKGTDNEFDSWVIYYKDGYAPEIVTKDPVIVEKVDMSNVDLSTITQEQLTQLKAVLGL